MHWRTSRQLVGPQQKRQETERDDDRWSKIVVRWNVIDRIGPQKQGLRSVHKHEHLHNLAWYMMIIFLKTKRQGKNTTNTKILVYQ